MTKSYTFTTFQELVDLVPTDRIPDCLTELGQAFSQAKAAVELTASLAGIEIADGQSVIKIPQALTWKDDGKDEIDTEITGMDDTAILTIKSKRQRYTKTMTELFELPESKSPRLKWLEKHGITARKYTPDEFDYFAGQDFAWAATNNTETAQGGTEDEAINQLALRIGIKLWNEGGTV